MTITATIAAALIAAGVPSEQAMPPAGELETILAVTPSCEELIWQRQPATKNAPYGGFNVSAPNPKAAGNLHAATWVAVRPDFTLPEVQSILASYGVCKLQGVNLHAAALLFTHEDAQKLTNPVTQIDPVTMLLYGVAGAAVVYAAVILWTSRQPSRDVIGDEIQQLLKNHG